MMPLSDNEICDEKAFLRSRLSHMNRSLNSSPKREKPRRESSSYSTKSPEPVASNQVSSAISWPILLAIIPTLGTFFAGSAEIWSDFIMILLILYYVYKWITVPWSYYESARTRRRLHQNTMASKNDHRRQLLSYELKRHELIGLIWVILSPVIAGYTLQYSRYFLNNYDKYMSVFNITVFVVAASLKPVSHIMTLLRERTLFLQSEVEVQDTVVETLQKRIDVLEDELDNLRQAFATKKDLGQATQSLNPTIQQLSKAMRRMEKKEANLRSWSETQFAAMEQKVHEYDQYICYRIEQDQRRSTQHTLITLVFLPLNLTLWFLRRMSYLLPIPRALLGLSIAKPGHSLRSPVVSKHLLHSEEPTAATTMHHLQDPDDLAELNYSGGEESAGFSPAFGHHHRPFTPKRP